jgi:hypothetical protein
MSRGPGQQTITELIASDPHGAWTVGQICERIYPDEWRVQKKHRVVVLTPRRWRQGRGITCGVCPRGSLKIESGAAVTIPSTSSRTSER